MWPVGGTWEISGPHGLVLPGDGVNFFLYLKRNTSGKWNAWAAFTVTKILLGI